MTGHNRVIQEQKNCARIQCRCSSGTECLLSLKKYIDTENLVDNEACAETKFTGSQTNKTQVTQEIHFTGTESQVNMVQCLSA